MARYTTAPEIKFFRSVNFSDVSALKRLYRELCMKHHPDMGGTLEDMQQVNLEYEWLMSMSDGQRATAQSQQSSRQEGKQEAQQERTYRYDAKAEKGMMDAIHDILRTVGTKVKSGAIEVEIIGTWIWVHGDTRPHANELGRDGIGLHWHSKRQKWYWKPAHHTAVYSGKSLDELGQKYGRQKVYA